MGAIRVFREFREFREYREFRESREFREFGEFGEFTGSRAWGVEGRGDLGLRGFGGLRLTEVALSLRV